MRYNLTSFGCDMFAFGEHNNHARQRISRRRHIARTAYIANSEWNLYRAKLSVQSTDNFAMPCMRKHINGLYLFNPILILTEKLKVACEGLGVAGNVYYSFGRELYKGIQKFS